MNKFEKRQSTAAKKWQKNINKMVSKSKHIGSKKKKSSKLHIY